MASDRLIAIVTGGAGGLGLVMVKALLAEGARVAILDIDSAALARAQARLRGIGGDPSVLTIRCDVSDECSVSAAVERVRAQWGPPAMLVNNAGFGPAEIRATYGRQPIRFLEVGPVAFARSLAVNLRGPYNMTRAVLPFFLAGGWGRIVNITIPLDAMLARGAFPYGSTKAGLESMTAILAVELEGTGTTANVLEPGGLVDTPLNPPESFPDRAALLTPEIMGPPIRFLASRCSDRINGRHIDASKWDHALSPAVAATQASRPIGLPDTPVEQSRPEPRR